VLNRQVEQKIKNLSDSSEVKRQKLLDSVVTQDGNTMTLLLSLDTLIQGLADDHREVKTDINDDDGLRKENQQLKET
jgi:hypothetical protein